jgi:hypothetical protein
MVENVPTQTMGHTADKAVFFCSDIVTSDLCMVAE